MSSSNPDCQTVLSLKEVSAKFEQWRASRLKKSRIPEALWQEAILLLKKYPIGRVTQTLKLSGSQIKAKMQQHTAILNNQSKLPAFVPISIPPVVEQTEFGIIGKLEIKRADGAVLSIDGLNQKIFSQLLAQFMQGLSC